MELLFIVIGSLLWIIGGVLFYRGVHRLKQNSKREG